MLVYDIYEPSHIKELKFQMSAHLHAVNPFHIQMLGHCCHPLTL